MIINFSIGDKGVEGKRFSSCLAPTRPLTPLATVLEFILIAEGRIQQNSTRVLEAIFTKCCNLAHVMNNSDHLNENLQHQEVLRW